MNYNKIIIYTVIFLFIIFILSPVKYSYCEDINRCIVNFVEGIYTSYAQEDFSCVYNKLYPEIKSILAEEKYVEFQKKNFKKYKLEITDCKVEGEVKKVSIPEEFKKYINNKDNDKTRKIAVSYHMSFTNGSSKIERDINKDVFIYIDKKENLYLLWDPQIIE